MSPATPMSARMSPDSMATRVPWAVLAFFSQSAGLLLIFVAGLVVVTAGVIPPSCYASGATCSNAGANALWGLMAGRVLLILGLFGLAVGAGLHLQFRPAPTAGATPEEVRVYLSRRRAEYLLLVITVLIAVWIIQWAAV
jgi:hypothetical protein